MNKPETSEPVKDPQWRDVPVGEMTRTGDRIMQRDKKWHTVRREFLVKKDTQVQRKIDLEESKIK